MEGLCLDLLALELCTGIVEVEYDATLVELPDEELGTLAGGGFWTREIRVGTVAR